MTRVTRLGRSNVIKRQNFLNSTLPPELDVASGYYLHPEDLLHAGYTLPFNPKIPDLIFGYSSEAFAQNPQLVPRAANATSNTTTTTLKYLFFLIQFAVDKSVKRAINACFEPSVVCVAVAEQINTQLRETGVGDNQRLNTASFCVAMTSSEASNTITAWQCVGCGRLEAPAGLVRCASTAIE